MAQPPVRVSKDEARTSRQAKAAALRESTKRAERRRKVFVRSLVVIVVLAVVAGIAGIVITATRPHVVALPRPVAATGTSTPPWAVPANTSERIQAARLSTSAMTPGGAHFHPHIDIRVDGKAVPVAANIGVETATGTMSELHTHDASGIVHIESAAKDDRYVLGQLFTEWNVRLDRTHLGGLTADSARSLVAFVDGKRFNGDPARIELLAHRQIALLFGTRDQQANPPSTYNFPAGE